MFERWRERAEELESEVYALALAARDPETPLRAKVVLVGVVAFAASPIDPIPDFVPVLGYVDDLLLLPLGVALALRLTPEDVLADCRERAATEVDVGSVRWVVAALFALCWLVVGLFVLRAVG